MKDRKVKLLCFDSFSVRSMATLVKLNKKVLLDPGIAIAPHRYSLPPTEDEIKALEEGRKKIIENARYVDIIFISHYHYDHHPFPDDREFIEAISKGKVIYMKNRNKNINFSQKKRGFVFESIVKDLAKEIIYCDGLETKDFIFSPPVWHGREKTRLGYVIMVLIKKIGVIFAPDVQGPMNEKATKWIIEMNPKLLIVGGPPTYLEGYKVSKNDIENAKKNLKIIMEKTRIKEIVIDHHLVRDINYRKRFGDIFNYGSQVGIKVETGAGFMGLKERLLEARRKNKEK